MLTFKDAWHENLKLVCCPLMVPMVNDSTGTPMQHNLNTGAELAVNYAVHNITVQAIISDILWNYNVVGTFKLC